MVSENQRACFRNTAFHRKQIQCLHIIPKSFSFLLFSLSILSHTSHFRSCLCDHPISALLFSTSDILKKYFLMKFTCQIPTRRHGRLKHPSIKATTDIHPTSQWIWFSSLEQINLSCTVLKTKEYTYFYICRIFHKQLRDFIILKLLGCRMGVNQSRGKFIFPVRKE